MYSMREASRNQSWGLLLEIPYTIRTRGYKASVMSDQLLVGICSYLYWHTIHVFIGAPQSPSFGNYWLPTLMFWVSICGNLNVQLE